MKLQITTQQIKTVTVYYYRSIPEFKEYILIDQTRYYIMQYVKNN
jgi:Uma2 family endonuclease